MVSDFLSVAVTTGSIEVLWVGLLPYKCLTNSEDRDSSLGLQTKLEDRIEVLMLIDHS